MGKIVKWKYGKWKRPRFRVGLSLIHILFEAGEDTAASPLVVGNPYLISPLTAMILFKTSVKQEVTLTVKGRCV